ncbi:GNAT family N-acetyltransferase [Novosphingobium sp. Leaf2]|uniref:GNAT family N-acetyltransferase n=1 Tax=Novosphingobium sp. Leaf2 TaxID=1735670 RepID=UPI0006F33BCF|nr:GNAT family N-acetyltransferase [Novosphingobium sp. Leaf2]KQM18324.1 GNAT family acetyltransferase [Novosphingobium sp. Leaf2]
MFIRSERLFLRPAWPEDAADLVALIDEPIARNLATVPWPYTIEDARAFVDLPRLSLFPRFLVTLPAAGGAAIAGVCGLSPRDGEANLGYWIARQHWGNGYATEAARTVLALARALGHRRVVASHQIDNSASARVLDKIGFRGTGRIVEHFSQGRGHMVRVRECEVRFEAPADCDGDNMMRRQAA